MGHVADGGTAAAVSLVIPTADRTSRLTIRPQRTLSQSVS